MDSLKITYQDPAALKPRATNPRIHSKKQIRQIADSIREFGFTNPILVDSGGGMREKFGMQSYYKKKMNAV